MCHERPNNLSAEDPPSAATTRTAGLAAACLALPLLVLGVTSVPPSSAGAAEVPHATQATGYDLVGADGGVFFFGGNFMVRCPASASM